MIVERKYPCKNCGATEVWLRHYTTLGFHRYFFECSRCHTCTKTAFSWKGAKQKWRKEMTRHV